MTEIVEIWTDGACRGNPGPGGWGAVLRVPGRETHFWGGEPATTNNRMELMAAIRALKALKHRCTVKLHTDSKYVIQGINDWMPGWKRKGWINSQRKPVKNAELWRALDEARNGHDVSWHWVKGHSGHTENDLADALANRGIDEFALAGETGWAHRTVTGDLRAEESA